MKTDATLRYAGKQQGKACFKPRYTVGNVLKLLLFPFKFFTALVLIRKWCVVRREYSENIIGQPAPYRFLVLRVSWRRAAHTLGSFIPGLVQVIFRQIQILRAGFGKYLLTTAM